MSKATQEKIAPSIDLEAQRTQKGISESHMTKANVEMRDLAESYREMYPGPQLTDDDLQDLDQNALRLPERDGNPDYSYRWLSLDPRAVPNLQQAIHKLGYTVCTVAELPEMENYRLQTMEHNLGDDKIIYREMILCKIHKQDLNKILTKRHHIDPLMAARGVYQNFWDKVENAGGGVRHINVNHRDPSDLDEDRSPYRGSANRFQNDSEATGLVVEGTEIIRTKPKFEM